MRRKQGSMVAPVNEVMERIAMPQPHQPERKKKSQVRSFLVVLEPFPLHGSEEKSHVNVVAKPERKSDMPSVPEISNIVGQERTVKIFRCPHAEEAAEANRERAITRKIEEQIKAVSIHVGQDLGERSAG